MTDKVTLLSREEVGERFFWYVRRNFRNHTEAAKHYGCTQTYISSVINSKRPPNKRIQKDIGVEVVKGYRIVEPDNDR